MINLDKITLAQVLQYMADNVLSILVVVGIFVEITPVKFNPISFLSNLLFKSIREDMNEMKEELNKNINDVKDELKGEIEKLANEQKNQADSTLDLIKSTEMNEISRIRWEIIEFSRSIDNGLLHTRDEYRHIKDDNIRYHTLIQKYELSNGLIDEEMMKINEHYENNKDNTSVYF